MTAQELKEIRKKLNFSQEKFAKRLNISLHTYQKYETGISSIPDKFIDIINSILISPYDTSTNSEIERLIVIIEKQQQIIEELVKKL